MVNFSIFNELSLPIKNKYHAQEIFKIFFRLLSKLKEKGLDQIRMSEDFKNYHILEGKTFYEFYNQQQDREFKSRVLSLATNETVEIETPLIKDEEGKEDNQLRSCEYFYNESSTDGGLAYCDIWNTLAVSFNSDMQWDKSGITLEKHTIEENDIIKSDITIKDITIKHASTSLHLDQHQDFFDHLYKEKKLNITPGNFWDNREKNFPKIIKFCPEVKNQIKSINLNIFKLAISILRDIEIGEKSIHDFNCSGESQTVNNDPKLKSCRMFTINGEKVFFQQHLKLSNKYRMYFLEKEKIIFIGYIGKHLQTKKFKQ